MMREPIDQGSTATVMVTHAYYSTVPGDPWHDVAPGPVACSGKVVARGTAVSDLVPGDRVAFLAPLAQGEITLPGNTVVKWVDGPTKEISIIPIASFAMKMFRDLDVSIGLNVVLLGKDHVASLLAQLLEISGTRVFKSLPVEKGSLVDKVVITGLQGTAVDALRPLTDLGHRMTCPHVHATRNLATDVVKALIDLGLGDTGVRVLSPWDVGLEDEEFKRGVPYPRSLVRWDFTTNLEYFRDLFTGNKIDVPSFDMDHVRLGSTAEAIQFTNSASSGKRYILEFSDNA